MLCWLCFLFLLFQQRHELKWYRHWPDVWRTSKRNLKDLTCSFDVALKNVVKINREVGTLCCFELNDSL